VVIFINLVGKHLPRKVADRRGERRGLIAGAVGTNTSFTVSPTKFLIRRSPELKTFKKVVLMLFFVSAAYATDDVVSAVHGTITKVDSTTKTVVVKTADGTEHSLHVIDKTAVHSADASAVAAKDSWHGLKEGSEVVVHYTKAGTEDTALEIDKVGKAGLKSSEGTIKDIDRGGKKLVVTSGDGAESTYRLTDHAAKDAGKDIAAGVEKGTKVTVYYTKDAGVKVAHFFERD
jgi:hypothetical protein